MPSSYASLGRRGPRRSLPHTIFTVVNGSLLAAQLLAAVTARTFMGLRVLGDMTAGFLLLGLQGLALLFTAVWCERRASIKEASEERAG